MKNTHVGPLTGPVTDKDAAERRYARTLGFEVPRPPEEDGL
jgi:hypothetical protein